MQSLVCGIILHTLCYLVGMTSLFCVAKVEFDLALLLFHVRTEGAC